MNKSRLLLLIIAIIAVIVIPLTVIQVQKQQEIRQRAASENSVSLQFSPSEIDAKNVGDNFDVDLNLLNSNPKDISAIDMTITYNSSNLNLANFKPSPESGLLQIARDTSTPGKLRYIAANATDTPIIGAFVKLGTLTFTEKALGAWGVGFSNVTVTANGTPQPLIVDTQSVEITQLNPSLAPSITPTPLSSVTITANPSLPIVSVSPSPNVVENKCQPPKVTWCGDSSDVGPWTFWSLGENAKTYRMEWCSSNGNFLSGDFENHTCGFILSSEPKVYLGAPNDVKVRVKTESSSNSSCQAPGEWSDIKLCKRIFEPSNVSINVSNDRVYAGETLKVSVRASDEGNPIGGIRLLYDTLDELDVNKNFVSVDCKLQKECSQVFDIKAPSGKKLNIVPNVSSKFGSGFILTKDKAVDIYGKKFELLETNQENLQMPKATIQVEGIKLDINPSKYYLAGDLAISLMGIEPNLHYVTISVQQVKSVNIAYFGDIQINPPEGSPGTLFTVTAKTDPGLDVKAVINGPGATSLTVPLLDDGYHGDSVAGDGIYGYVFDSADKQNGLYSMVFTVNGKQISTSASFIVSHLQSACIPFADNQSDDKKKIDIVVISDSYSTEELDEFQSEVLPRHINFLFSKKPYSLDRNIFNVWFIKKAYDMNCSYENAGNCFVQAEKAVSGTCSFFDKIIVLDKLHGGGYGGSKVSVVGFASIKGSEGGTVHEFGHTMGKLADEYEAPQWTSNTRAANCDVFACPKWCSGTSNLNQPTCYAITNSQECAIAQFNGINCVWFPNVNKCDFPYNSGLNFGQECKENTACLYGCGGGNGYRSSKYSIMGDPNNGIVREYNAVSEIQVQKMVYELESPPAVVINDIKVVPDNPKAREVVSISVRVTNEGASPAENIILDAYTIDGSLVVKGKSVTGLFYHIPISRLDPKESQRIELASESDQGSLPIIFANKGIVEIDLNINGVNVKKVKINVR